MCVCVSVCASVFACERRSANRVKEYWGQTCYQCVGYCVCERERQGTADMCL